MATKWKVEVDWNRDGIYSEVTEHVTELQWFLGFRAPYMGTASEAYLHLTLNNADKRFSPENSSGPLYGNLAPLRPLRVTSDDGSAVRTHWSGWINMIEPAANKYGARQANILATGAMQFLKATETKIELQENQRSDQIIDTLIQEVIFPPALSDSWVLGDPDLSRVGESTKLANLEAFRDYEEGVLTLNLAGDNWVRRGGFAAGSQVTLEVQVGDNAAPVPSDPKYSGEFLIGSYRPQIMTGGAVMFTATLKPATGDAPEWGTV